MNPSTKHSLLTLLWAAMLAIPALLAAPAASAQDRDGPVAGDAGPAGQALDELRNGRPRARAIRNRFFLKQERFAISPLVGYVPNNPFAKRYVGGLAVSYHFNEEFGAEGQFSYSPDFALNDLKGLTKTLVRIAHSGAGGSDFQQPLDKVNLAAAFHLHWSPLYGKINLVGETVLNFDL